MLCFINRRIAFLAAIATIGLLLGTQGDAQTQPPGKAPTKSVQWFRDAKFGMFVHWGVYSLLGRGEWVMNNEGIPISEYQKLPPQFNPTNFNAREWVKMVKDSGMKYITITSKHHDGFSMFDTSLSNYDIMDATPFKRDPIKELAQECRRQGIKLFFYYSQLDWYHPDFYPRGGTGRRAGRPDAGDWNKYKEFYIGQVRELCTKYGEIGGLWFDGWWDVPKADWGHDELYSMIHQLQPKALVGNNHHVKPFPGEDFQMFEQDLPGENTAGFNKAEQSNLPFETCRTINNSWGLNTNDKAHKSTKELVRYLVAAAGRNANLLLNTGPLPTGEIQPEHKTRYLEMGQWLKKNGKSIYATEGGPLRPQTWGVTTYRGKQVFLHILNFPANGVLELPAFPIQIRRAQGLHGGKVEVVQSEGAVKLTIPADLKNDIDTIIRLDLAGEVGSEKR